MRKTEFQNAYDLVTETAKLLKFAEKTESKLYNLDFEPKSWPYYRNTTEILLDHFLNRMQPGKLAEYQKMRGKGYV